MSICLTCSSNILETPNRIAEPTFITPCCSKPICAGCLDRNPRLREYIPCLRCGDLTTAEGSERIRKGREVAFKERQQKENVFAIGDDDDGEEETAGGFEESRMDVQETVHERPGPSEVPIEDDNTEVVEVYHQLKKGDTLLAIARKYAADPHELITLNNLPHSALSTQPHILRTRKQILISQRRIPKRLIPADTTLFSADSLDDPLSDLPDINDAESAKRERERAIKRFQLMTKTVDPHIGAAYMGLSELDENDPLGVGLPQGGGEGMEGKKLVLREEGNRETRALDSFFEDEDWEREAGGPSKSVRGGWKVVGDGSKLGIKV